MTDEYPEARSGQQEQENQTLDTERAVVEAPVTGDTRVDDAIAGLSRLPGRPVEEHVAILEEAYGRLRDILDDLGPGHAPAGGSVRGARGDGIPPKRGLGGWVPPEGGEGTVIPPGQP